MTYLRGAKRRWDNYERWQCVSSEKYVFVYFRKVGKMKPPKLTLGIGGCYSMCLIDGTSITFRFVGADTVGRILVRTPPNSQMRTTLESLIGKGYTSYMEVECP